MANKDLYRIYRGAPFLLAGVKKKIHLSSSISMGDWRPRLGSSAWLRFEEPYLGLGVLDASKRHQAEDW